MSRVVRAKVVETSLPLDLDLGAQYARIESLGYALVGLVDGEGRTGAGWTFSIDPEEALRIAGAVRERTELVVGIRSALPERSARSAVRVRARRRRSATRGTDL